MGVSDQIRVNTCNTSNIHCIGASSVRSFVRPSVSQSVGPSISPFVDPSTGWMHRCLPVRLVRINIEILKKLKAYHFLEWIRVRRLDRRLAPPGVAATVD